MKQKTETVHIRITQETMDHLNDLASMWGLKKTAVIERLINGEWLKSTDIGQQKIQELMDTFGVFQKQVEEFNK